MYQQLFFKNWPDDNVADEESGQRHGDDPSEVGVLAQEEAEDRDGQAPEADDRREEEVGGPEEGQRVRGRADGVVESVDLLKVVAGLQNRQEGEGHGHERGDQLHWNKSANILLPGLALL